MINLKNTTPTSRVKNTFLKQNLSTIISFIIGTTLFQFFIRIYPLGQLINDRHPQFLFKQSIFQISHDLTLNLIVGMIFLILSTTFKIRVLLSRYLLLTIGILLVLLSIANISSYINLGHHLNYKLIYYSEFFLSKDAQAAASNILTPVIIVILLSTVAFYVGILKLLTALLSNTYISILTLTLFATVLTGIYIVSSSVSTEGFLSATPRNFGSPVISLASTITQNSPLSDTLLSPEIDNNDRHSAPITQRLKPLVSNSNLVNKNIIVIVLESVGSEHIEKGMINKVFEKHNLRTLSFNESYAQIPATAQSMLSMLCSIYPELNYWGTLSHDPNPNFECITDALNEKDYKTAFFSSADLRFGNQEQFLNRRFDVISDYRTHSSDQNSDNNKRKEFLHASSDSETFNAARKWLQKTQAERHLAVIWTNQTHYPYVTDDGNKTREANDYSRYSLAIQNSINQIDRLISSLENLDNTLFIVTSDHGEEFGETKGHASNIKPENMRIPLILGSRDIDHSMEINNVFGLVDLVPTIASLVGLKQNAEWMGINQNTHQRERIYFFTPYGDLQAGFATSEIHYTIKYPSISQLSINKKNGEPKPLLQNHQQDVLRWMKYVQNFYNRLDQSN